MRSMLGVAKKVREELKKSGLLQGWYFDWLILQPSLERVTGFSVVILLDRLLICRMCVALVGSLTL